jgi:hypothetical protein
MSENESAHVIAILLMVGALLIAVGTGLAYWVKWWAGAPVLLFGIVWLCIVFGEAIELSRGGGPPCP